MFQPGDQPTSNQPPTAADAQTEPAADDTARSVKQHPPELHIERIEHTIDSGDIRMQLWATFRNTSQWTVEIDKISMFGRTNDLYHQLSPGDADQLEAYDGPVLRSQPGGYASIQFVVKDSNDYFRAEYQVRYKQESDGNIIPTRFDLITPVRDI